MVLLSCLQKSQAGAEVNPPTKDMTTSSKALPITLLVIGTLTVLVAALIGIPGLLSTTSSLNLPSSFAWIHAIGTPGLAAILGAGGTLGLSVIALSGRRLCQTKHTEILASDEVKQKQINKPIKQADETKDTSSLDVIIVPFEQWTKVTDQNCIELLETNSLEEFYEGYHLEPGNFILFHDCDDNYQAVAYKLEEGNKTLFFSGNIQEANRMKDEEYRALDADAVATYNDLRRNKIETVLCDPPFNLKAYVSYKT